MNNTFKLSQKVERREALCRHLSESESSLEMEEDLQNVKNFLNLNYNLKTTELI